jgi:hypothetical protein
VLERVALSSGQWPTLDPFLFCVHHLDRYPQANGHFGPATPLAGRSLGSDFSGRDGWSMYHGTEVPGFPQHPHRGFETVTVVRRGLIDHADSLGAAARYGHGDVQWLTAGRGIVHAETFPLLREDAPNPLELFQLWLNLPARNKMVDPSFTMFWAGDVPVVGSEGARVEVIAGAVGGVTPLPPPPASWAAQAGAEVAIWHLELDDGAAWTLPAAAYHNTRRTLYLYRGESLDVGGVEVGGYHAAVVRCDEPLEVRAGAGPVSVLVLQGRPIGEPVAQYGPFVMTSEAEIRQAFSDYQQTRFGGWPWPEDSPVHGYDAARFARYPDGNVDRPNGNVDRPV